MELVAGGLGLGAVLLAAWVVETRRHARRTSRRAAEWDGARARPDLWTSSARCRSCGASGGLLEVEGDELRFVCLACGHRHARESRG